MRPLLHTLSRMMGFADANAAADRLAELKELTGMRTTLTEENAAQLPALLDLMRELDVQKFYLSHLNYSGRGRRSRALDAHHRRTRSPGRGTPFRCRRGRAGSLNHES